MSQCKQNNKNNNSTTKDQFSNHSKCDQYGCVEPLPESSRPRRDGPGGEDGE